MLERVLLFGLEETLPVLELLVDDEVGEARNARRSPVPWVHGQLHLVRPALEAFVSEEDHLVGDDV